jgi:hypothetical protein
VDAALCCKQRCTPTGGMARPTSRQGRTNASVLRTRTVDQKGGSEKLHSGIGGLSA